MKRVVLKQLLSAALFAFLPCFSVRAQYSIDWFKVAGGGGTSTGNVYSVSGTIGQQDATRAMSGGSYSLTGGFWSLIAAVQTPGAPLLSVNASPAKTVVISWPYPSIGFSLEQNGDLGSTNWAGVAIAPVQSGSRWQVVVSSPTGNMFYRLRSR